jgi:hypothetical protein
VGLFCTAFGGKPAWRVWEEKQSDHDDDREERLESNGEAPLDATCGKVKSIIDPVSLEKN